MKPKPLVRWEEKKNIANVSVREIVESVESRNSYCSPRKTSKSRSRNLIVNFIRSRYIGFLIGPLYGIFLYYYLTALVLHGPPFTTSDRHHGSDWRIDTTAEQREVKVTVNGSRVIFTSGPKAERIVQKEPLLLRDFSHVIGGSVGAGTGTLLTFGSFVSPKIRCGMMLVIPSLCAKRGRSFMLTAAAGFLLAGPIATIDYNIQQVVGSLTCMYEQVKSMADDYIVQFEKIWIDVVAVFRQVNSLITEYQGLINDLNQSGSEDVKQKVAVNTNRRNIIEKKKLLKDKLNDLQDAINEPGNVADWLCDKGKSIIAWSGRIELDTKNWLNEAARDINEMFPSIGGLSYQKSGCESQVVFPDARNSSNIDSLKKFMTKMKPSAHFIDLDEILEDLEQSSITNLRMKLKNALRTVLDTVRNYSVYIEKLFYLAIILVLKDALKYMRKYYADDSFDNMMVDDNLRHLWVSGEKEKIVPLRRWELRERFQYSATVKISSAEAKRIFFNSIPTIMLSMAVACILMLDYALSTMMIEFQDQGRFGVSYQGMEQGILLKTFLGELETGQLNISALNLKGYNLTTEPCLPKGKMTDLKSLSIVIALVLTSLLSCIFDAYASRLRAKICNLYFPERAKERAEYLYKRIQTGRATRRIQLPMIVGRELDQRARSQEFCACANWLYDLIFKGLMKRDPCPGCLSVLSKADDGTFHIKRRGIITETPLCYDCLMDAK